MSSSHTELTGVRHLCPIPLVEFSAYLVGRPTPRLEVTFTNKGSTKR
jgi:hypothetical protein